MFTPFKIPPHKQVDFSCPWSSLSKRRVQLFYLAHVPCDGQSCIFYFFEGWLLPDWSGLPWLHQNQRNVEISNHHLAKKGFCLKLHYEGTHRAASACAYLKQSQVIIKPGCKSNVHFSLRPPTFWGSTQCVSHLFMSDGKGKITAEYPHGLCTYAGVPSGAGTRRAAWWCALQSLINQWLRQKGLQGLAPGTLEVWHYNSLENILTL